MHTPNVWKKYINQDIQFLLDMFVENGDSKSFLQNSVCEYQNI